MTDLKVGDNVLVCTPWSDAITPGGHLYYTRIKKIGENSGYFFTERNGEGFHPETLRSGPYAYLIEITPESLTRFYEQEMWVLRNAADKRDERYIS